MRRFILIFVLALAAYEIPSGSAVAQDTVTMNGLDFMVDWPKLMGQRVTISGGQVRFADSDAARLKLPGGNVDLKPQWVDREDLRYIFKHCTEIPDGSICVTSVTGTVAKPAYGGDVELTDVDFDIPK